MTLKLISEDFLYYQVTITSEGKTTQHQDLSAGDNLTNIF